MSAAASPAERLTSPAPHEGQAMSEEAMTDLFQMENFTRELNACFTLCPAGGSPITTELVEVRSNGYTVPGRGKENFSLLFSDRANPSIGQGLVKVRHPRLGEFELFLVPVMPDRPGVCYQAVFNFLADA